MNQQRWQAVDDYLSGLLIPPDPALESTLRSSAEASLPPISVTPQQGKLLYLIASMNRARTVLEIGTLGGYSTIWLARALPSGGRVVTLEADAAHAEVARDNIAGAGLAEVVEVHVGPALETLPKLAESDTAHFDLTFIDADKHNSAEYFQWAIDLARPGSVIIVDNVVRDGAIADTQSQDPSIQGIRKTLELASAHPKVEATCVPTVDAKGYDGFMIATVGA